MFKYYFLIGLATAFILGQVYFMSSNVEQLPFVKGVVKDIGLKTTGYYASFRKVPGHQTAHSFVITLNNNQSFNAELQYDQDAYLDYSVHKKDSVTIYYPTLLYKIFTLDVMKSGTYASEVRVNGEVVYSYEQHKAHQFANFYYYLLIEALLIVIAVIAVAQYWEANKAATKNVESGKV